MRNAESEDQYVARLAQELEDEFQRIGPGKVCAFVAETMGGSATGCALPVPGYFRPMKKVCDCHGALLILDEVMCGMGRTGMLHAWEQENVIPDIQIVGKGLGAGYSTISAVLVQASVVTSLQKGGTSFAHGQTYMAHPLSAAAALEVQRIVKEEGLVDHVKKMGQYLGHRLNKELSNHPHVGDIRGRGLFWAIDFVADKKTKEPFPKEIGLATRMHGKGLSPGYDISLFNATGCADGYAGDHFVLAPPYVVQESDVDAIVARVVKVIEDAFWELSQLPN